MRAFRCIPPPKAGEYNPKYPLLDHSFLTDISAKKTRKRDDFMIKNRKGFTLVEVIVVLVILAILAAIMIPSMTGWIDRAREESVHTELRLVALAAQSAFHELYAQGHQANNHEEAFDAVYIMNGEPDSVPTVFKVLLEEYINDDAIWENLVSVSVSNNGKTVYIFYNQNGEMYQYKSLNGTVTIGEYTPTVDP
ncbi:MAG: prepilin-type N-terminal cleavage/methylation domain-containing protein [Oscillospiraceae bacterium]|nr:prepilin-type N-terminal cleavage/methylation domain-containing protein [Oscillospiraceae bacterium]